MTDYSAAPTAAHDPDSTRIAIVGAGASGLTAAHTLRRLGYKHVTVFESEPRVGGKVHSYQHEGQAYELGGAFVVPRYATTMDLAREYAVATVPSPDIGIATRTGELHTYRSYLRQRHGLIRGMASLRRFMGVVRRFRGLQRPGLAGAHPDLHLSFHEFSKKHRIEIVADVVASMMTGCGYGYFTDVPALYLMKVVPTVVSQAVPAVMGLGQGVRVFKNGWQELWQKVAQKSDVRCGAEVTRINRREKGYTHEIEVVVGKETHVFDRVILSCPLDKAHRLMDLSREEAGLFDRIRHCTYVSTLIEGSGLPHCTMADSTTRDTIGHVCAIGRFRPNSNVCCIYQLAPDADSTEKLRETMEQDIQRLGAKIHRVLTQKVWHYFPHVSTDDLNSGYYERLEALQGERGTYLVGGLMNFETVEQTSEYAALLVHSHFGPSVVRR